MPELASEASQLTDGDAPRGLARRRFLTFLVAAPALTVAARVGTEAVAPARADAVVPSLPQPADVADFGDVMTALTRADTDLFVLQVTADNRIRFEVPRAEVGQGITTALAMIVADELDARLADVDVPLSGRAAGSGHGPVDRRLRPRCAACGTRCVSSPPRPGPAWSPRPRSGGTCRRPRSPPTTRRCGRRTGARPRTGR